MNRGEGELDRETVPDFPYNRLGDVSRSLDAFLHRGNDPQRSLIGELAKELQSAGVLIECLWVGFGTEKLRKLVDDEEHPLKPGKLYLPQNPLKAFGPFFH